VAATGVACVWVDLCAPDPNDLRAVARALGLPYRAALATLSPEGQPHVVQYHDYATLRVAVARRESVAGNVVADPLDIIVGRNVLVTIHRGPLPALQRARLRGAPSGDDAAPALAGVVLVEILTSEEALARWVAREADGRAAGAQGTAGATEPRVQAADAVRARRAATTLQRLAERRASALAVARMEATDRRVSPALAIPSLDYLLTREARLVTALRATETRADGAVRLRVAHVTVREQARRTVRLRLACVLAAAAVAGLARLALSGAHLAAPATTLICFLIAGAGGRSPPVWATPAAWGDEDGESG